MKQIKTVERKIMKHESLIKKFRADKSLNSQLRKGAIFNLKCLIRELKWILN
jgi:hypothetical protein